MKKKKDKNELVGGGLPLATANLPTASGSSATPTSGGHPRNAPGEKELQTLRLDEICESIVDCPHSTPKWTEFGLTVLRSHNIRGGKLDLTERSYTDKKHFDERNRRARPQLDDLVITREAPMGEVCIIPDGLECCLGQRMVLLRPNQERVFPKYLLYAIQGDEVQHQISWSEGTGSTVSNLRIPHLQALKIPLPPLPIQKRIASILGALDDKIALNRRINQTLEQMAQALFQSWFVDFDPVKAKQAALEAGGSAKNAELAAMQAISGKSAIELKTFKKSQPELYAKLEATAKLFPSKLVESELGLIPEGWEWKSFGVVSKCFDSKRIPLSKAEREKLPGIIPYYGATSVMDFVGKYLFDDKFLLLGEDGSVLKDDGTPFVQYIWGKSWVNNHAHVLQGADSISTEHLMVFIKSRNITPYVNGAVQMKLNQKNMNSIPFLFASEDLNITFSKLADALYSKFRILSDELKQLEKTRDSLLPKLLSGEIEVSNIALEYSK